MHGVQQRECEPLLTVSIYLRAPGISPEERFDRILQQQAHRYDCSLNDRSRH
jgi:hypothetical protein